MKQEKRQQIIRAAERLFNRGRFHEIKMEEVAHEAGVGKGTLYRYFSDKDDLFFQVMLAGYEELARLVSSEHERASSFTDCLGRICRRVDAFYRARHQLMHAMPAGTRKSLRHTQGHRQQLRTHRRILLSAIGEILAEGQSSGAIRNDLPTDTLAVFLLSSLQASSRLHRAPGGERLNSETIVDLFLHGTAAPRTEERA